MIASEVGLGHRAITITVPDKYKGAFIMYTKIGGGTIPDEIVGADRLGSYSYYRANYTVVALYYAPKSGTYVLPITSSNNVEIDGYTVLGIVN